MISRVDSNTEVNGDRSHSGTSNEEDAERTRCKTCNEYSDSVLYHSQLIGACINNSNIVSYILLLITISVFGCFGMALASIRIGTMVS